MKADIKKFDMLSQPIFDDRSLSESFYKALLERFYDSLHQSTQSLLGECSFGMAPSPTGVKTFFIVAPTVLAGEQLIGIIDTIRDRVAALMGGVGQVAICINPPKDVAQTSPTPGECDRSSDGHPEYMMCKIFPIFREEFS